jgi:dCMP deaminase
MPSRANRPTWDDFFIGQLPALAARATCDRGRSAAIFVRDNDQLASGYVGSPPGMPHCDDVGHLWDATQSHCLRTVHAEQNAMLRALRHGISLRDTTVYCTMTPCFTCAKLMVGVGVYRVVALYHYHAAQQSTELFADAGVILRVMTDAQLYEPTRRDA